MGGAAPGGNSAARLRSLEQGQERHLRAVLAGDLELGRGGSLCLCGRADVPIAGKRGPRKPEHAGRCERHGAAVHRRQGCLVPGLRAIAGLLRRGMHPQARLVLGGPYPNGGYGSVHLQALHRVLSAMRTWQGVDHVIDFLQPAVHDGEGRWHPGASSDPGHPNDLGHQQMFECLDLQAILGPLKEPSALCPLLDVAPCCTSSLRGERGPLQYRFAGQRTGQMKDAAVGWFEQSEEGLVWKSFNGQPEDRSTWVARNTFCGLTLQGDRVAWAANGVAVATLDRDSFGAVAAVTWGAWRWELFDGQPPAESSWGA